MKNKLPLRRFDDIAGVVLEKQLSNKTPLHRSASHMVIECPICGLSFTRKASEAKRNDINYCSRACAGIGSRRQVKCHCRICGKEYSVKQCHVGKVTCCSEDCRIKAISESTSAMNRAGWESGMFGVGEDAAAAKLTESQVYSILADNRGNAELAKEYGLTRAAIRAIRTGSTWRHLKNLTPSIATPSSGEIAPKVAGDEN
jgi:hypothetical protein